MPWPAGVWLRTEKYGVRPVLAYTYVGPEHSGVSYRAAGWERCEETISRGHGPGRAARGVDEAPGAPCCAGSVSWARRRPWSVMTAGRCGSTPAAATVTCASASA